MHISLIHDNPGKAKFKTQYRNPQVMKSLGYDTVALWDLFDLAYLDDLDPRFYPKDSEARDWVDAKRLEIQKQVQENIDAGMDVFLYGDFVSIPQTALDIYPRNEIFLKNTPDKIDPESPVVRKIIHSALEEVIRDFPQIAGVMLRIGENYQACTPHLFGNDPCHDLRRQPDKQDALADRIASTMNFFHQAVCEQHGLKLIIRTWDTADEHWHSSPEVFEKVAKQLPPPNDLLYLCIKFTQTDFWPYQPWNPTLRLSRYKTLLEVQCQREYELKGAIPNYQGFNWIHGAEEMQEHSRSDCGINNAQAIKNYAGIVAWPRGGGWGGPFPTNELWIDLNVYTAGKLKQDSHSDAAQCLKDWIQERFFPRNNLIFETNEQKNNFIEQFAKLITQTAAIIRKAFYVEAWARHKGSQGIRWTPSESYFRDHFFQPNRLVTVTEGLLQLGKEAEALEEKTEAQTQAQLVYENIQKLFAPHSDQLDSAFIIESFACLLDFTKAAKAFVALGLKKSKNRESVTPDELDNLLNQYPLLQKVLNSENLAIEERYQSRPLETVT